MTTATPLPRPGHTLVFVFGTLKQGFPNFATNRGRRVGGTFRTLERLPLLLVGQRHVPWLIHSPSGWRARSTKWTPPRWQRWTSSKA